MAENLHNDFTATRLTILVRAGGIDALAIGGDGQQFFAVEVDQAITAPEKTLEEAVYACPKLLGDFSRIDVIVDTDRFVIIPGAISVESNELESVAARLWPDAELENIIAEPCSYSTTVASLYDRSLTGFVGRTFPRAALHNRVCALTDFFASLSRPVNKKKLYANFSGTSRLDIIVITADDLIMANSYPCAETLDAVYYIMAAVKDSGLDPLDDEVILCGDQARRSDVTDTLRRYLNSVMPLLLPAPENEMPVELLYYLKDSRS